MQLVHWLRWIFSHLALNQIWIEISAWNFKHLFITCLRNFYKNICWDISKRKKWWVSGPIGAISWKDFQYLLKNGILKFFERVVGPPSQCPRSTQLRKVIMYYNSYSRFSNISKKTSFYASSFKLKFKWTDILLGKQWWYRTW